MDERNNSWNAEYVTEDQALKYAKSLTGCRDCRDCRGCRDCIDCSGCSHCRDCIDCSYCRDCRGCSGCNYCRDCIGCIDCRDCRVQPDVYTTKRIGSRNSPTIFYRNEKSEIFVSCGCWKGCFADFQERVQEVYPTGEYGDQYRKEIQSVERLWLHENN